MGKHPPTQPARTKDAPANIFTGIKNLVFAKDPFTPSREDVERICRSFAIGELRNFQKDKGLIVSHNNPFVFAVTTQGRFALKFYEAGTAAKIAAEYALNRVLLHRRFPTPEMRAGWDGRPFLASNGRLATCFSYIDGKQSWQCLKQRGTIRMINTALLSLKDILAMVRGRIPFREQPSLMTAIQGALAQNSRLEMSSDAKKALEAHLLDAGRTYKRHRALFTRQLLHNHANFCNFLIHQKTVYLLDMEHIKEDHVLADLASLVISSLFFATPRPTIRAIVKDYFAQHTIGPDRVPVLSTLVKVGLVEEYLRIVQAEESLNPAAYPPDLLRSYMFHLAAGKRLTLAALKKMSGGPGLIV